MKKKRFSVISLHCFTECQMNCPFCYKRRSDKKDEKPEEFWYDLIPYISKLTNQVAQGGGEPFMRPNFIKEMGRLCKKNSLLYNVTSNGRLLMDMNDKELKDVLKDITMVSLSFDNYKIKSREDMYRYCELVKRIKKITKCQVGTNLLINEDLVRNDGFLLKVAVGGLFKTGVSRVFTLCPKNIPCPDILKIKDTYLYLTLKYPLFFIDDATRMVLEEERYSNWKHECHYAKDLISISEKGLVFGCSFDPDEKSLLKLNKPKDLLKIIKIKADKRYSCPYIKSCKHLNSLNS